MARNHNYERYDINSTTVTSNHVVPEPLTILGAGTAVAFGISFKRKVNQSQNQSNKS
ncbi:PEP-CTERM sorting domain-containing protein [Crocosphaera watsonii]|uniref:PEP-CTERM sorting domain-containing protein n=1 Tax=Crocosphaera watsonii TaxID=263511 RepID=UPI003CC91C08